MKGLYICRIKNPHRSQDYYYVRESGSGGRDILSLGHNKDFNAAYSRALQQYMKLSAKLQIFEELYPIFTKDVSPVSKIHLGQR